MMETAVVTLAGATLLVALMVIEARAARERALVSMMESVLCRAGSCDIESGLSEY